MLLKLKLSINEILPKNFKIQSTKSLKEKLKKFSYFLDDICDPPTPECLQRKRLHFHPNELPPQANIMFHSMDVINLEVNRMRSALKDALAGASPGYLQPADNQRSYPAGKSPFPVWTPVGRK